MKHTEPLPIGRLLEEFFERRKLPAGIAEGRAVEVWGSVVGEYAASFTEDVYIRNGVLYVTFSSAAVRSEIHIRRRFLVGEMNTALGAKVVKNIVVK